MPPECIVIWGTNPVVCNSDAFLGHWIVEAMKRGSELVAIDPQLTWIASKARHWLRLRPGTDAALALGMLNVIIEEDLVDHDFIDKWTYGFEALAERVADYPPAKVAEICWIEERRPGGSRALLREGASVHHPVGPRRGHVQDRHADGACHRMPWPA